MQDNEAAEDVPASPDERWFVDDDGTAYEWDSKARRFVEAGTATAAEAQAAAADASFDQADQTFSFEAEVIPAMPEPELVRSMWEVVPLPPPCLMCRTDMGCGEACLSSCCGTRPRHCCAWCPWRRIWHVGLLPLS